MIFARSFDFDLIRTLIAGNYAMASDDGSASIEAFAVNRDPRIRYVLAHDGAELVGMLMFLPETAICWTVHFCMVSGIRGRGSRVMREGFRWFFEATGCRRIVGAIPSYNRLAIRAVERAGAKQHGCNPGSWLKDGKVYDQILLGVSPGDV